MKTLLLILTTSLAFAAPVAPYHQRADKIVHILKREGAKPDREAIALTLKAIDINIKKYFPKGPFTAKDFQAIAMAESRWDANCLGTSGERSMWQIMPYYAKGKNLKDPFISTEIAFRIMLSKYRQFPNKRLAIIAYNGLTRRNGVVRDGYYVYVMKQKARISNV